MSGLRVLMPGPLATIQDLGRPGYASVGVGWSGAADRSALKLANRLVGNDENAPALELVLGRARFRAEGGATVVAVTGMPCPVTVGGRAHATGEAVLVPDGAELEVGLAATGLRCYVAMRGGVAADRTLGSASSDLLAGLGPSPLRAGDVVLAGDAAVAEPYYEGAPLPQPAEPAVVDVVRGPRDDWITPESLRLLLTASWRVEADADRTGVRLTGPALRRARDEELPSEGTTPGAVQVPASGQPVLFLADAPVTGGYPVVAVATARAVDVAAQLRPGDNVRFAPVAAPFAPVAAPFAPIAARP